MPSISTPLVTLADVQEVYEGDLSGQEARVERLLDVAVAKLMRLRPTIEADVASGAVNADLVAYALVSAVLRVLRNPGAYRSETAGEYSYTLNNTVASGLLSFTAEELADVTPVTAATRGGVRSVRLGTTSWFAPWGGPG